MSMMPLMIAPESDDRLTETRRFVFDAADAWPVPGKKDSGSGCAPMLDALIISDLHLGSDNSQVKSILELLSRVLAGAEEKDRPDAIYTRRLIINGDVFDSIDFRRLKKNHWRVLSEIRHLSDKMDVIWIAGNHDGPAEIISHLLGVTVKEEYILESGGKRILCVHGDEFDEFIEDHPIITRLADMTYALLQKLDRRHYVARLAKRRSKTFLHCMNKIEDGSRKRARALGCQMATCGHTHFAAAREEGDVWYYNSGCWTETPCHYITVEKGVMKLTQWVDRKPETPAAVMADVPEIAADAVI